MSTLHQIVALMAGSASAAPGADPDDVGINPWAWVSAHPDAPDPLVLNDNDPMTTWLDSGPAGRNYTQGTAGKRPTFQTDVLGAGLHGVLFDGSDDELVNTDNPNVNAMHVIAVISMSAIPHSGAHVVWWCQGITQNMGVYARTSTDGFVALTDGAGNTRATDDVLATDGTPYLLTWMKNPAAAGHADTQQRRYIRINGIYQLDAAEGNASQSLSETRLGGPSFLKGYIHELAAWSGQSNCLSDALTAAVEERFAYRWGL